MLVAGMWILPAAPASALNFTCLTGNDAGDCAMGESQLSVAVTNGGSSVTFHFSNEGPDALSISEIYFDDGALLNISTVFDGPGVDFEEEATPMNLPGANLAIPPFVVTEGFLAHSDPSVAFNGVGPGEFVGIEFLLQGGMTVADVLNDLADGSLRVGIHVIGYDSSGSESFINIPVPEPGTGLLVGAGLLILAARRRR